MRACSKLASRARSRRSGPQTGLHTPSSLAAPPSPPQLFLADRLDGGALGPARLLTQLPPGRALGARYTPDGSLLICSAPGGLLRLSAGARAPPALASLTARVSGDSPLAAGRGLVYVNSVEVDREGMIYFTHSTDIGPFK